MRAGVGVGAHLVLSQRLLGAVALLHLIAADSGMSVSSTLRSRQRRTPRAGWEPRTPTPWHTCQSGARGGQGLRRRGLSWTASISAGKETPGRGRGRKADHPSLHGPCSAQGNSGQRPGREAKTQRAALCPRGDSRGAGLRPPPCPPRGPRTDLGRSPGVGARPSILRASAPRTP